MLRTKLVCIIKKRITHSLCVYAHSVCLFRILCNAERNNFIYGN